MTTRLPFFILYILLLFFGASVFLNTEYVFAGTVSSFSECPKRKGSLNCPAQRENVDARVCGRQEKSDGTFKYLCKLPSEAPTKTSDTLDCDICEWVGNAPPPSPPPVTEDCSINNDYQCTAWGTCDPNTSKQERTCTKIAGKTCSGEQEFKDVRNCSCPQSEYSCTANCAQYTDGATRTIEATCSIINRPPCRASDPDTKQGTAACYACGAGDYDCPTAWQGTCSFAGGEQQTRTCKRRDGANCTGPSEKTETQNCPRCTRDNWRCTDFGPTCNGSVQAQARTCTLADSDNCPHVDEPKPPETQSCSNYTPPCTKDTWTCTEWSACAGTQERQTRTCTLTDCPHANDPEPQTIQDCPNYTPPIPQGESSAGGVLPTGAKGDTLYTIEEGGKLKWKADGFLYNSGSAIGIGVLAEPQSRLHIKGGNPWGTDLSLDATGVPGGKRWTLISSAGTASEGPGKLLFKDQSVDAVRMVIDRAGRVGIGTVNPGIGTEIKPMLEIESVTSTRINLIASGKDGTQPVNFFFGARSEKKSATEIFELGEIGVGGNQDLALYTADTPRIIVTKEGGVVIGKVGQSGDLSVPFAVKDSTGQKGLYTTFSGNNTVLSTSIPIPLPPPPPPTLPPGAAADLGGTRPAEQERMDVSVDQSATPNPVTMGNRILFTVTVKNNGPVGGTVEVTSKLDPALPASNMPQSPKATCRLLNTVSAAIQCTIPQLASGETFSYQFNVSVLAPDTIKSTVNAIVIGQRVDPDTTNNTSFLNVRIDAPGRERDRGKTGPDPGLGAFLWQDVSGDAVRFAQALVKSAWESVSALFAPGAALAVDPPPAAHHLILQPNPDENVGIGIRSGDPAEKLQVQGSVLVGTVAGNDDVRLIVGKRSRVFPGVVTATNSNTQGVSVFTAFGDTGGNLYTGFNVSGGGVLKETFVVDSQGNVKAAKAFCIGQNCIDSWEKAGPWKKGAGELDIVYAPQPVTVGGVQQVYPYVKIGGSLAIAKENLPPSTGDGGNSDRSLMVLGGKGGDTSSFDTKGGKGADIMLIAGYGGNTPAGPTNVPGNGGNIMLEPGLGGAKQGSSVYYNNNGSILMAQTGGRVIVGHTGPDGEPFEVRNANGGSFKVNPSDGGLELASGNDNYAFIDFKGKSQPGIDYTGRIWNEGGTMGFITGARQYDQMRLTGDSVLTLGSLDGRAVGARLEVHGSKVAASPQPLVQVKSTNGGTAAVDIGGQGNNYWRIAYDNYLGQGGGPAGRLRIQPIENDLSKIDPTRAKLDAGITILRGIVDGEDKTGYVGIGEQNPWSKLDVRDGDINVSYLGKENLAKLDATQKLALAKDRIGLDVAELYEAQEEVEVGDIVVVGNTERKLQKSRAPYEKDIIGIVSGAPALLFEGSDLKLGSKPNRFTKGTKPPVALAGRVPIKISLENGPIAVGDYLTSSLKPGIAMKATEPGMAVGIALESYTNAGQGDGKIIAFINIGEKNVSERLKALEREFEALKNKKDKQRK